MLFRLLNALNRSVGPNEEYNAQSKVEEPRCPGEKLQKLNPCARIAYALKRGESTELASKEMMELLPTELPAFTLVPVPSSTGSIDANRLLCKVIARKYGPTARVMPVIRRVMPVESSCHLRRQGLAGTTAAEHKFVRVGEWIPLPVFLVDNVATTGATLAAARQPLGFGTGLVFADALDGCLWPVRIRQTS